MKEASYYQKIEGGFVKCLLCPRNCTIPKGKSGFCNVRKNISGILYSLSYGNPIALNSDPIEKKPFFHFLPGSSAFSIGTFGCNLSCLNCQNWEMSRGIPKERDLGISPKEIVSLAVENRCKTISFTYNEPTVFFEYALDIAKLAKKSGLRTSFVSNGYINEKPLLEISKYLDADNVDLKGFLPGFYRKVCSAELNPVLNSLLLLKKKRVHLEITNLIIPGLNDNMEDIERMCIWIKENLGRDVPLHFSRFFPMYKMENIQETPIKTLERAYSAAKKYLDYVYVGNVAIGKENTFCPNCKKMLIERFGFSVAKNSIKDGKCGFCGREISGVWK